MLQLLQSPDFWLGIAAGLVIGAILGGLFVAALEESARSALNAQLAAERDRLRGGGAWPAPANDDTGRSTRSARADLRSGPR